MVHLVGIEASKLAVDSLLKDFFLIAGNKYREGCVKKDNFWNVVEQSRAQKNNYKDRDNQLVIAIFSRKV